MRKLVLIIYVVVIMTFIMGFYSEKVQCDIKDNVIRLHIIANSDSQFDQEVKYRIRDKLIANYNFDLSDDILIAKQDINDSLPLIEKNVNEWLLEEQVDYTAKAVLVSDEFPTKQYGNLKLPAGEYTALKVILGDGKGQNWWCVMFPPICFVDGTTGFIDENSQDYLKDNLSNEEYKLLTDNSKSVEVRFKVVELWQKFRQENKNV